MNQRIKKALIYASQPRTIIFVIALLNFAWFLFQSRFFDTFGSASISFCVVCPWYWDWSLTNLPSLSLIAAFFTLLARWQGYLVACLISGYQVIDWINWMGSDTWFLGGLIERLRIVSVYDSISFWEMLDLQYFLALIIFVVAFTYLALSIASYKQGKFRVTRLS